MHRQLLEDILVHEEFVEGQPSITTEAETRPVSNLTYVTKLNSTFRSTNQRALPKSRAEKYTILNVNKTYRVQNSTQLKSNVYPLHAPREVNSCYQSVGCPTKIATRQCDGGMICRVFELLATQECRQRKVEIQERDVCPTVAWR